MSTTSWHSETKSSRRQDRIDTAHRPLHDEKASPEIPDETLDSALNCRVLVVEDDRDHQPLLSWMLGKAGASVTIAENGKEAIESAMAACDQGRPFDIILMDVQMPVLDGPTTTRRLRSIGFRGPIVALTARAVATDRERCIEAGCDDFLSKPIDRRELVLCLAGQLERAGSRR